MAHAPEGKRPAARATRMEADALGAVELPLDAPWGAQTQRALEHFAISEQRMPEAVLRALLLIKRCAAEVNAELGELDAARAGAIQRAADAWLRSDLDEAFPLSPWQSGSGTQTHMNVNEVLARRATQSLATGSPDAPQVHPNDHVNRGQSSNDVMPTAMHLAAAEQLEHSVLPALQVLRDSLAQHAAQWQDIVKIGRTHLQDATPLSLGQEVSGWVAQLDHAERTLRGAREEVFALALGGTAVGTGLNTHPRFAELVVARLAQATGLPWVCAPNRFAALAAHDALLQLHAGLRALAVVLLKIAGDVRWMGSGPRCGLGELRLPENEPGSSIMPGKINPTQCEALIMVCYQVMGNDLAVSLGAAGGRFELNTCKPLIACNLLHSLRLLGDAMRSFERYCARGLEPDRERIAAWLERSLMLVTALTPHIGYERAARIARHAHQHGLSLREAALDLGELGPEQFDAWVQPRDMLGGDAG